MPRQVEEIITLLTLEFYPDIIHGLTDLEAYLGPLVPSVQTLLRMQTIDSRLFAFMTVQDSFQCNFVAALIASYEFFLQNTLLVQPSHLLRANQCMCGLLLTHSASRKLFERKSNMRTILAFLHPANPLCQPAVSVSVLSLLVHVLLKSAPNFRMFEQLDGCTLVSQHLKIDSSQELFLEELPLKVVEFFIFYLTEEMGLEGSTRTVQDKANLLRPVFPGIDELLRNLENLNTLSGQSARDVLHTISL